MSPQPQPGRPITIDPRLANSRSANMPSPNSGLSSSSCRSPGVRFSSSPVTGSSRQIMTPELNSLKNFESHAISCTNCHDPYYAYKHGRSVCSIGRSLALDSDYLVYYKDKDIYARTKDNYGPVRVEVPSNLANAYSVLRLISKHGEKALSPPRPKTEDRKHHHKSDKKHKEKKYHSSTRSRNDSVTGTYYPAPQHLVMPYPFNAASVTPAPATYQTVDFQPSSSRHHHHHHESSRHSRSPEKSKHRRQRSDSVNATIGERYPHHCSRR